MEEPYSEASTFYECPDCGNLRELGEGGDLTTCQCGSEMEELGRESFLEKAVSQGDGVAIALLPETEEEPSDEPVDEEE